MSALTARQLETILCSLDGFDVEVRQLRPLGYMTKKLCSSVKAGLIHEKDEKVRAKQMDKLRRIVPCQDPYKGRLLALVCDDLNFPSVVWWRVRGGSGGAGKGWRQERGFVFILQTLMAVSQSNHFRWGVSATLSRPSSLGHD